MREGNLPRSVDAKIYKEGWMERAIVLRKLNKSLLESSKSVGIHCVAYV